MFRPDPYEGMSDQEFADALPKGDDTIDSDGRLHVKVEVRGLDGAPKRLGWKPYWANIDLRRTPQAEYTYVREQPDPKPKPGTTTTALAIAETLTLDGEFTSDFSDPMQNPDGSVDVHVVARDERFIVRFIPA